MTSSTPPQGTDPGAENQPSGGPGPDLESPGAAGRAAPGVPPPPGTNQARTEPAADPSLAPPAESMTSTNPQAPSAARIAHEPAIAAAEPRSGEAAGAGNAQGVGVPPAASAPGTSQEMGGVADIGSATPVDPGHQAGAANAQRVTAAHRPHAPDGENAPT